jgi:hypothetical protein
MGKIAAQKVEMPLAERADQRERELQRERQKTGRSFEAAAGIRMKLD